MGFLQLAKKKGERIIVKRDTVLITEEFTLEQIYNN